MKKALILGAGMVAKPIVDYLLETRKVFVVVATRTLSKAQNILLNRENTQALTLQVDNDADLENTIKNADIVISLLPYTYHVKTAKYCLKHHRSLVTTSYVSPQMRELDGEARDRNLLLLNEIGLDPGIDHMSAMRIIHDIKNRNGEVLSFRSYCGGIPAPEANTNPWGYKFSWSPRGVLMAGRNNAKFLQDGQVINIEGKNLFQNKWPIKIETLALETYPNRDSLPYMELYGIQTAHTMYRGTLRYPGWCRTMLAISELNLLSETKLTGVKGLTYNEIFKKIFGSDQEPIELICQKLNLQKNDEIIGKLQWLRAFTDDKYEKENTTPIDFLSDLMLKQMNYNADERDMIVLHHEFLGVFKDHQEQITSTLIDFGIVGGSSAMSRTVSLPAAIAVKLILEGNIKATGVQIPVDPHIYNPVLDELENLNIVCKETVTKLKKQ